MCETGGVRDWGCARLEGVRLGGLRLRVFETGGV